MKSWSLGHSIIIRKHVNSHEKLRKDLQIHFVTGFSSYFPASYNSHISWQQAERTTIPMRSSHKVVTQGWWCDMPWCKHRERRFVYSVYSLMCLEIWALPKILHLFNFDLSVFLMWRKGFLTCVCVFFKNNNKGKINKWKNHQGKNIIKWTDISFIE